MAKVRMQEQPIRKISWDYFHDMVYLLSEKMGNESSGVVGIPRGGVIVATCLCHINENLVYIHDHLNNLENYCAKPILIDDIVDSGETIKNYHKRFKTASLFYRETSRIKPDFYAEKIDDDTWIQFPWEIFS